MIEKLKSEDIQKTPDHIIKEFLENHLEALWTPLSSNNNLQGLPIHFAIMYGRKELVQYMLEKDAALIDSKDIDYFPPITWAIQYNHLDIVDLLLEHRPDPADLYQAISNATQTEHLEAMHQLAQKHLDTLNIKNEHREILFRVVCLIILKKTENQPQDALLEFVTHINIALALLQENASLIHLFMQNERTSRLISDYLKETNKKNILTYNISSITRRPSFLQCIHPESYEINQFFPTENPVLGKGKFGLVRVFEDNKHQKIAVKSGWNKIKNTETLRREVKFNQIAYPEQFLELDTAFFYASVPQPLHPNHITYRQSLPYLEGKQANTLMGQTTDLIKFAELTLRIAKELQRLHELGIIHGDFHLANVLIDEQPDGKIIAHAVDFALSSLVSDESRSTFPHEKDLLCLPPELRNEHIKQIKPHPNQDIYTFAYAIDFLVQQRKDCQQLRKQFPSIMIFLTAAQNHEPTKRPSLSFFCTELEQELSQSLKNKKVACSKHSLLSPQNKKRKNAFLDEPTEGTPIIIRSYSDIY
jgi:hypothetical protein